MFQVCFVIFKNYYHVMKRILYLCQFNILISNKFKKMLLGIILNLFDKYIY